MSGRITPAEIAETLRYAEAGFAPRPGWAPATAYATDWRQFAVWCDVRGVIALPCSADTLTTYLSDLARSGLKAGTIARRAAAIAQRHRIAGLEPPTGQEAAKTVKRGIRRMHGTVTVRKAAATADIVAAMLVACDDTLAGIRDRALVSFGYAAALSRPRLVALTLADLPQVKDDLRLHPAKHMRAWLADAEITEGRIFRSVISGYVGEGMTGFAISKRIKTLAKRAGHDPQTFSASSLRAGFLLDHRLPRSRRGL